MPKVKDNGTETRMVTIETRLSVNSNLVKYMQVFMSVYSKYKRQIWQEMTNKYHADRYVDIAEYKKTLRADGLLGRTVNSLVNEVQGNMNAYMQLKKYELSQLKIKLSQIENMICKIKDKLFVLKQDLSTNKNVTKYMVQKYHNLKRRLYWKQNKLNHIKQRISNLEYQIEHSIYKLCFGTKTLFSKQYRLQENGYKTHTKWYNDFVKNRDKNVFYLGANNETMGNQMFQLYYNIDEDNFTTIVRKESAYCNGNDDKYVVDNIDFKYRRDDLIRIIKAYITNDSNKVALNYRVCRKSNKWYLQVIFAESVNVEDYKTSKEKGTIGLDYNDGFIELSETNRDGNLIHQGHYILKRHGTGKAARTEIQQIISKIVQYAESKSKDIIAEDLNFKTTKARVLKANSDNGKAYNKMLHIFDYNRYKQVLHDTGFNHRVRIVFINPRNTTKESVKKYGYSRKLNRHQAASYGIARAGQGFSI